MGLTRGPLRAGSGSLAARLGRRKEVSRLEETERTMLWRLEETARKMLSLRGGQGL